jgi:hypothetical protein
MATPRNILYPITVSGRRKVWYKLSCFFLYLHSVFCTVLPVIKITCRRNVTREVSFINTNMLLNFAGLLRIYYSILDLHKHFKISRFYTLHFIGFEVSFRKKGTLICNIFATARVTLSRRGSHLARCVSESNCCEPEPITAELTVSAKQL